MPLGVRIALALLLALALLWVVVQSRARTQEARAEAAFPPEGRILEVNGHRVHALSMGSGPDIVLIHGASGNLRDMTLSLAPRLAKRYRVTLLDRPGLGYTDRINRSGATIRQQAELLSDAARQIGVENPIVLGHSYGGAVALAWAVHRPDHIAALVPLSSPAKPWDGDLSAYYKLLSHPVLGPLVIPFLTAFVQDERVERAVAVKLERVLFWSQRARAGDVVAPQRSRRQPRRRLGRPVLGDGRRVGRRVQGSQGNVDGRLAPSE